MKTIYGSLAFYDSLLKQDRVRKNAIIPIHCPVTQLPPFEFALGTDTIGTVDSVELIDKDGNNMLNMTDFTGWTNGSFVTLNTSGLDITLGITSNPAHYARLTEYFAGKSGDVITIRGTFTSNSGGIPVLQLHSGSYAGTYIRCVVGYYEYVIALPADGNYQLRMWGVPTPGDGNFSFTGVTVGRTSFNSYFTTLPEVYDPTDTTLGNYIKYNGDALTKSLPRGVYYVKIKAGTYTYYSDFLAVYNVYSGSLTPKHVKIEFSNTDNFGDLMYEDSFKQTVWLEAKLNNPTHEMVNVGEEKDGIFIAEKIVSKFIYNIIAYISQAMYNCLIRLPQHDTITITDEVGNTYTPAVGNIIVEPAEWSYYDVCRIIIKFNDNDKSSFVWTK